MKIFHLSDLHLGKRLHGYSLIEDQKYILEEILTLIEKEEPHAVIIAGDVYDKTVPGADAVNLLDSFLYSLSKTGTRTFIISGNHDSAERLAFASRLLKKNSVFISEVYNGTIEKITLTENSLNYNFYLLPFIKPSDVRRFYPDEKENINNYNDALALVIENIKLNKDEVNILITHQFISGASTCESEDISIGGLDNVDAGLFKDFDYVALGHIHSPQFIGGSENIRYCGTPLKYSFSEANQNKSLTVIDFENKGNLKLSTKELTSKRDLIVIKDKFNNLVSPDFKADFPMDSYIKVILTDEVEIPYALSDLRKVFPNIMVLQYDNSRTKGEGFVYNNESSENKSPEELFSELFKQQNNREMEADEKDLFLSLLEKMEESL